MISSNVNTAAIFFLDDVPGASIPASRLWGILEQINLSYPLTIVQQEFLRQHGYDSLLQLSHGELDLEAFRIRAQAERKARLKARSAACENDAIENDRKAEITQRKNAALFAERDRKLERRRKLRELPDSFGLPFIDSEDFGRVNRILRAVSAGQSLEKDDLVWLGSDGNDYWTDELRKAHHENMARIFCAEWKQTGDVWKAINACGHFRKAERPLEGLKIAEAGLVEVAMIKKKERSALLTTGGGAHRDLRRFEDAARFGKEAHSLRPKDFRPCTLLGAVHIEMGAHSTGAEWYEKAEARGASRNLIDRELQSILSAASHEERNQITQALKARDASRYSWL